MMASLLAMKGKVFLIQFPFDDLSSSRVRPAYCLTHSIGAYQHVVFALITSQIDRFSPETEVLIDKDSTDFST